VGQECGPRAGVSRATVEALDMGKTGY
jgi:hypothetical protein